MTEVSKYYSKVVSSMDESAIFDGRMFRWFDDFILDPSSSKDFLIKIPSNRVLIFHGRDLSSIGAGANLTVYVNPTFSDEGTLSTNFFNLNARSSFTPDAQIWENPTINDLGVKTDVDKTFGEDSQGNRGSTGSRTSREFSRVMPLDTYMLARVENRSNANNCDVTYKLFWEEY